MIQLGISPEAHRALLRTLAREHIISTSVTLLDLDHKPLGLLPGRITGGQVNFDAKAQVTRQAQITMIDPERRVAVDYDDGSPRLNRMVRVHYSVWVPGHDWISIPIFTGPITQTTRDEEGVVTIEASSKQHLSIGPTEEPRTFAKGLNRVNVIRTILNDLSGETRFRLPKDWRARTAKKITMSRESSAWSHATILARSMNAQLYYDGWGWVRLRKVPVRPAFTFRDGEGGMILGSPTVTESSSDRINKAIFVGAVPKGKTNPLVGSATLPPWHRYSPQSMARGGRNKFYIERNEDDSLRSQKEVDEAAKRRITREQIAEHEVSFTCLPMPLLEEGDIIVVDTEGTHVTAPMTQMSLPLGHDGVSTIGYLAPVSKRKPRRKR